MLRLFLSNLAIRLGTWWRYQPPEFVSHAVLARLQRRRDE